MRKSESLVNRPVNRRSFLKKGMLAGSAATLGAGLVGSLKPAFGQNNSLTKGDVAILRMLAAAELIEAGLWTQYAELGGIGDNPPIEVAPNTQLNSYQAALSNLDSDGPQYITSNTLDEVSHATFLNGYLESKGERPVNFDEYRTLQGSTATGADNIGRLTCLQHLNVDTSWFIRYRSQTNPDFGATFPQAVTIQNRTAIPITDADLNGSAAHIQVIATSAFQSTSAGRVSISQLATLSWLVQRLAVGAPASISPPTRRPLCRSYSDESSKRMSRCRACRQ